MGASGRSDYRVLGECLGRNKLYQWDLMRRVERRMGMDGSNRPVSWAVHPAYIIDLELEASGYELPEDKY
jgi:hypothetical protein